MRKRSGRPPRFAQVPNETVDDSTNLDLTALGLLTAFLRHKDGWDITLAKVGEKYGHGEDAMANAMGALQIARYVVKVRAMGAGNQWRTEVAVYAPPATDAEVEQLLADIRAEDPDVRRVEVIEPTATAIERAQKRRTKLVKKAAARAAKRAKAAVSQGSPGPGIPGVGEDGFPDSGVSRLPENPRVSKETVVTQEDENDPAVADAVGKSAGGFASAGASDGAAGESGEAEGGSAASGTALPAQRKTSPRPATTKTRPRKESPGFEMVRAAIPPAVAAPGTRLYPGLHRAINDLLDGAPGIPRRTPEQVIARINRRWYGEHAEARAAVDYRGCDRCTASSCTAPRKGPENPEGCDRIRNRNAWLAAAVIAQDCPNPACEDGQIIGGGDCRACQERAVERREIARVAAETTARWEAESEARKAAQGAVDAWTQQEAAEEARYRQVLGEAGVWGVRLDHQVGQHMAGWRERNPRPACARRAVGA
ncbi:hypothetical protein EES44_24645 [Streptomyces sp. ADI96-15]|uniref:hypothetical protein n=1 Tax=Streptomyces sp. ADI96-15 TaxID=1522761 RepID=UPI000F9AF163|nr:MULTISPECIES: hypothetical protein [unclassified Streptomyces]MDH6189197.1 hypothetical protein [Streptomyces sp. CZ24]RPK58125.1 hypothetical protein EES44_24645 [Streptomyces sp. ADI96-15]